MSLNSASANVMASGDNDGAGGRVPRLTAANPHSMWRGQMTTHLDRALIPARVYTTPIPQFALLVERIEAATVAAEQAAIAVFCAAGYDAAKYVPIKSELGVEARALAEDPAKKAATAVVAWSQKAYALIYSALSAEVTVLVGHIPRGYAYGLWDFLETRYRPSDVDAIPDLLVQWGTLAQESGESFDQYKARVDTLNERLTNAGEKPSANQYTHALTGKLQPTLAQVAFSLTATGKLKVPVDWAVVTQMMLAAERAQQRLDGDAFGERSLAAHTQAWSKPVGYSSGAPSSSGQSDRGHDGRGDQRGRRPHNPNIKCYNCNKRGHISRQCPKPLKVRHDDAQQSSSSSSRPPMQANSAMQRRDRHDDYDDDDYSDDGYEAAGKSSRGGTAYAARSQQSGRSNGRASHAYGFSVRSVGRFAALDTDDDEEEATPTPPAHRGCPPATCAAIRAASYAAMAAAGGSPGARAHAATSTIPKRPTVASPPPRELKRLIRPGEPKPGGPAPLARSPPNTSAAADRVPLPRPPTQPSPADRLRRQLIADGAKKVVRKARNLDAELNTTAAGIDSMASSHVTGNRERLYNVVRCAPLPVKVADGTIVTVMHKGSLRMRLALANSDGESGVVVFHDVYWSERFDATLISLGRLRRLGWSFHMTKDHTVLVDDRDRSFIASSRGCVTVIDEAEPYLRVYSARITSGAGRIVCRSATDLVRLHQRVGHVGFGRLVQMCEANKTDGVGELKLTKDQLAHAKTIIDECAACIKGKMARPALGHRGLDRGDGPGRVLHMDSAVVTTIDARTGNRVHEYWNIVVDPYSNARWTNELNSKHEVARSTIATILSCQAMTGHKVHRLHCDNGTEYVNQELVGFCRSNGTTLITSPPYTPELNGIAERNVALYKDGARTMMCHAGAPQRLWRYAARHQAYVWNRTRVAKATGMTPYEALHGSGRTPSILHVGVWGCDAWVHRSRLARGTTFDAKAEAAIYLGHDEAKSCALVWVLRTGKVEHTRNIDLRETSFANMAALGQDRVEQHLARVQYEDATDDVDTEHDGVASSSGRTPEDDDDTSSAPGGSPRRRSSAADEAKYDDPADDADADSDAPPEDDDPPRNSGRGRERAWPVESVIDHQGAGTALEYKVRWVGYKEPTWEPARNLAGAEDAVNAYNNAARRTAAVVHNTRSRASQWSTAPAAAPARGYHSDGDVPSPADVDSPRPSSAAQRALKASGCSRL